MSFEYPLTLAFIPVVLAGVLWVFARRIGSVRGPVLKSATTLWAGPAGISQRPRRMSSTRGIYLALGLALGVAALARPQWGTEEEVVLDQAREVVLALDLSRSMEAGDVTPTRLERAKLLIDTLLDELRGERVGLVVFAGTSFLQVPLSADYEVMRDLLPELSPDYLPQGGTDYAAMLRTALRSFHDADGRGDRFLVVLSDGEAHSDEWRSLLPALRERGIRVVGLGVGTAEGAVIPDGHGGLVKDNQGAVVLSRLAPETLTELASETDGAYHDAFAWVDVHALVEATVARGLEGDYREGADRRLQDRFQWFLLPALFFLGLAFWRGLPVQASRRALRSPITPRGLRPAAVPVLALALAVSAAEPSGSRAAEPPPASANPLEIAVADLSERSNLGANDYARLAEATLGFAASDPSLPTPVRAGVIDDGLVAVERGEALDADAADWPVLRQQLAALRDPPEPPQPEPDSSEESSQGSESSASSDGSESESQADPAASSGGESGSEETRPDPRSSSESSSGAESPESSGSESATNPQEETREDAKAGAGDSGGEPRDEEGEAATDESRRGAGSQGQDAERDDTAASSSQNETAKPGEARTELDAEAAGFGELAPEEDEAAENLNPGAPLEEGDHEGPSAPEARAPKRTVGGGPGESELSAQYPQLAGALGHMKEIRENDSPGVLFQRMNALDDPRPRPSKARGKDW